VTCAFSGWLGEIGEMIFSTVPVRVTVAFSSVRPSSWFSVLTSIRYLLSCGNDSACNVSQERRVEGCRPDRSYSPGQYLSRRPQLHLIHCRGRALYAFEH